MKNIFFVFGIFFTTLAVSAEGGNSDSNEDVFSIKTLNLAISLCDPTTCINTCACEPNEVEWTFCVDEKCNMTRGRPNIGSCLDMEEIGDMCALFTDPNEVRTCPPCSD